MTLRPQPLGAAIALAAWTAAAGLGCAAPTPSTRPPNVLLIVYDDLHYDDLGSYGNARVPTPSFDRVANEGLRFTQYYAMSPACSPTRVSILTGRYPQRFNMRFVIPNNPGESMRGIPGGVVTLGELLRDRGYRTAHLGKWHVGNSRPEFGPARKGFELSILAGLGSPPHRDPPLTINEKERIETRGEAADVLTDRAIDFLGDGDPRPFFLNLWYVAPHVPLNPPASWAARYPATEWGKLAATLSHLDENLGRLDRALADLGLKNDTLLLVTSDNGGLASLHPDSRLKAGKGTLFEGGIRVPLLARWPGRAPSGGVADAVVASFDLLPTIAEAAGIGLTGLPIDGESFLDLLRGGSRRDSARRLFWEYGPAGGSTTTWAVRQGDWKLLHHRDKTQLLDLHEDLGENRDLSTRRPELVVELEGAYRRWRLVERRLGYEVAGVEGEVELEPGAAATNDIALAVGSARFGDGGGTIRLRPSPLLDFHDGDFTLALRVRAGAEAWARGFPIAERVGSWELIAAPGGRLRLTLETGEGSEAVLEGGAPVGGDAWRQVAFSVRGRLRGQSRVRLFLDAELQAETESLEAVRSTDAGIAIGPVAGVEIADLGIYLLDIEPTELDSLRAADPPPPE